MSYDRGLPSEVHLTVRPLVARFALAMEARLQANEDKPHWKKQGLSVVWAHFEREVQELREELHQHGARAKETIHEAADVACCAAMIADIVEGIEAKASC